MKKHALVIFLWLFVIVAGGYLVYHEVFVMGKTLYLKESLILLGVAFGSIVGVYFLLKKGVPLTVIKLIVLVVCAFALFVLTWLGL